MPRHVLIHPGFHKTGTSTLQRNLLAQRKKLDDRLAILLNDDVIEAARLARKYSVHRLDKVLEQFTEAFATAIAAIDDNDDRPLFLSSEALIGQLPGRKTVTGYDAAPPLLRSAVAALRARFGKAVPITVWFTTRNPDDWKKSAYYQNLRLDRLREDFATHAAKLDRAARLDDFVADTRDAIGAMAKVRATRIEDCAAHRLGPLGLALDLLGVPSDDLTAIQPHNVQPSEGAAQLLELNRSKLSRDELAKAKRALIRDFRQTGQTTRR